MDIKEIIKALSVLKHTDTISYVSVRYIDIFDFEVKRTCNKNCHYIKKVRIFKLLMANLTDANKFISLEVRYTNKLGYPCSIYKFK